MNVFFDHLIHYSAMSSKRKAPDTNYEESGTTYARNNGADNRVNETKFQKTFANADNRASNQLNSSFSNIQDDEDDDRYAFI